MVTLPGRAWCVPVRRKEANEMPALTAELGRFVSGLTLKDIHTDCDANALLVTATPSGPAWRVISGA